MPRSTYPVSLSIPKNILKEVVLQSETTRIRNELEDYINQRCKESTEDPIIFFYHVVASKINTTPEVVAKFLRLQGGGHNGIEIQNPQKQTCKSCGFAEKQEPRTTWEGKPDPIDYKCEIQQVPPAYENCPKWKPKDEQKQ